MKTLIRGGTVIDGTGGAARTRDVLLKDGRIDVEAVENAIRENTGLIIAQRSRGYAWRPSLRPEDFEDTIILP